MVGQEKSTKIFIPKVKMTNLDTFDPPRMSDKYYIGIYRDGSSKLVKYEDCESKKEVLCNFHHAKIAHKIRDADLVTAVTQRFYDYHYLFINFIATDPTNVAAYNAALANLLTVFSDNLSTFTVQTNGVTSFEGIGKAGATTFFTSVSNANNSVFHGYTQHNALNVRVRPIFDSKTCQAGSQAHLRQTALFLLPPAPGGSLTNIDDSGDYNFTWVYENQIWKIKSWLYNDKFTFIVPAADVILQPTPYQPSPDVPEVCPK